MFLEGFSRLNPANLGLTTDLLFLSKNISLFFIYKVKCIFNQNILQYLGLCNFRVLLLLPFDENIMKTFERVSGISSSLEGTKSCIKCISCFRYSYMDEKEARNGPLHLQPCNVGSNFWEVINCIRAYLINIIKKGHSLVDNKNAKLRTILAELYKPLRMWMFRSRDYVSIPKVWKCHNNKQKQWIKVLI